ASSSRTNRRSRSSSTSPASDSCGLQARCDMESLEQRIQRAVQEKTPIVPYDARWPEMFRRERDPLLSCLPNDLIRRIEHFGSTAVPGLAAKPVVDILVEVTDLQATQKDRK